MPKHTPESGSSRERWRRIGIISRRVFFIVIASLPVVAHYTQYDPVVVLCCLVMCLIAGLLLDSSPIVFTLLGALFGSMCLFPGPRRGDADLVESIFACAFLGFCLGLLRDAGRNHEKKISSHNVTSDKHVERPPENQK